MVEALERVEADERVCHDLLHAAADEYVGGVLLERAHGLGPVVRQRAAGQGGGQVVVADDAGDLLNDILGYLDLGAPVWNGHRKLFRFCLVANEAQRCEHPCHIRDWYLNAEHALDLA
jgi:hypothetical protein